MINGQSVAVVSSNNPAIKNVYEKLEKNGISFIAASLGKRENKQKFIESQTEIPDLSSFKLTTQQKSALQESNTDLFIQLSEKLSEKNVLASLNLEIENIKTEYQHFFNNNETATDFEFKKNVTSDQ